MNSLELIFLAERLNGLLNLIVKVYKFLREADQVVDWINEQVAVAASEDYGRDVEHVEILIQKFESFLSTLNARLLFHSIYLKFILPGFRVKWIWLF